VKNYIIHFLTFIVLLLSSAVIRESDGEENSESEGENENFIPNFLINAAEESSVVGIITIIIFMEVFLLSLIRFWCSIFFCTIPQKFWGLLGLSAFYSRTCFGQYLFLLWWWELLCFFLIVLGLSFSPTPNICV
jgi:hypothetical protein